MCAAAEPQPNQEPTAYLSRNATASASLDQVLKHHPSEDTKYRAVYAHFYTPFEDESIAIMLGVTVHTVKNWVRLYKETLALSRKEIDSDALRKFKESHRVWIYYLVNRKPLLFAHEIHRKFHQHFFMKISCSSICRILHEGNYSKKVVERRVQIRSVIKKFFVLLLK
jgi:transposase